MTSVMLATYPEVFAAGAIIAGLPYGPATNVKEAHRHTRVLGRTYRCGTEAPIR
jgi:poly(3-hydroxybutyrate) depolymerase